MEGEFIPDDDLILFKPYDGTDVPFQLSYRDLKGPAQGESFRRAELHLTFDKDESDSTLIQKLLEAGLYGAYMDKSNGHTYLVLTAQGGVHEIQKLYEVLKDFVTVAGGLSRCTIKNERAIRHAIYDVSPEDMPKVIDEIAYG